MNEEAICPFCNGKGRLNIQNYLTYYFDNMPIAQPVNMNIRYTINTGTGDA